MTDLDAILKGLEHDRDRLNNELEKNADDICAIRRAIELAVKRSGKIQTPKAAEPEPDPEPESGGSGGQGWVGLGPTLGHRRRCVCGTEILCQHAKGRLPSHKTPAGMTCSGFCGTNSTVGETGGETVAVVSGSPPTVSPSGRGEIAAPLIKDVKCECCGFEVKLTDRGLLPTHFNEDASYCVGSGNPPGFKPGANGVGGKAQPIRRS